ncbi:MAG: hypothetical protein IKR68_00750 [Lachnospiraceae bacterium]|nr:hypothetical protein [Lachnospiraceae bacterium]
MAKKLGKFLAFAAIASAAAGAYYYYKNKSEASDYDDFVDFDDEDDSSLEDYLKEEAYQSEQTERSLKDIFPINLSSETVSEARETLKKAVLDIGEKVADVAGSVTGVVKPSATGVEVEDFQFYDLSAEDLTERGSDPSLDIINTKKTSKAAEAVAEAASDAVEGVKEAAGEVAGAVEEAVAEAVDAVAEPAEEEEKSAGEILFEAPAEEEPEKTEAEADDDSDFSFEDNV